MSNVQLMKYWLCLFGSGLSCKNTITRIREYGKCFIYERYPLQLCAQFYFDRADLEPKLFWRQNGVFDNFLEISICTDFQKI